MRLRADMRPMAESTIAWDYGQVDYNTLLHKQVNFRTQ